MSGIATRWVTAQEFPVTEHDLTTDGTLDLAAVERWLDTTRAAYLDHCALLQQQPGLLTARPRALPDLAPFGRPTTVYVSAGASEVHPASFTVSLRLRPFGGDVDTPLNTTCVMTLVDDTTGEPRELGTAVRDELIALEHAARHMN
ncbi:hypothetical protein F0L68_28910 [Solihabitans fulvus]|uniref:Uncharacterized protein n=1 Tax=Solihabitans fulvus TaxID=1892852 RepID=A0A5B2WX51_9PSEU|nr:hypothetical protein [Solihabitans fulvus]KAA2255242.1 hypothetical protein F0L68_28910 [Solihabitans fulvus]